MLENIRSVIHKDTGQSRYSHDTQGQIVCWTVLPGRGDVQKWVWYTLRGAVSPSEIAQVTAKVQGAQRSWPRRQLSLWPPGRHYHARSYWMIHSLYHSASLLSICNAACVSLQLPHFIL